MSRSGYIDDCEQWDLIRWRGSVKSAIRGRRGQAFLRDLRDALDALPEKRLIANQLIQPDGECCALGAVARCRAMDVADVDPEDRDVVAALFDIAPALAAEIVYENDECGEKWAISEGSNARLTLQSETPEERWQRMRAWADGLIKKREAPDGE